MRSQEQMCELFEDIPEALVNSVEIAKRCSVELTLGEYFLPQFPTGDMSTEEFLVKVSKEGLERRLLKLFPDKAKLEQHRSAYDERLEIELEVINNMGFPGYFLFDVEPRLQQAYDGDEEVKELIDMARILEGVTRNAGKHAGGVVISPTTITDFSPLYCDDTGANPVTQFDKNDVETAGLVKFDFLGLRTLTIIQWALETIKQVRGEDIDITQIPFVDPP